MKTAERKIDQLGRLVLPKEFRMCLGLAADATVEITIDGDAIVLRKPASSCRLCGTLLDVLPRVRICSTCARQIREIDVPQAATK